MNSRIIMVVGLGAMVLAAGCSSSSSGGSSASPTLTGQPLTPTAASSPTATVTATPTPTPTVTVTAPTSVTSCRSSNLTLSLAAGQGTAGATYQAVVFTNTGASPCKLSGFPGVSFVDASGARIGKPSARASGKLKTVTLAPSGQASATLKQPDPGAFPRSACHQTIADRLKVFPPGETVPLFVHDPAPVCSTGAGRATIYPIEPGSGA